MARLALILSVVPQPGGITGGDALIAGATLVVALATGVLAIVAYRQLRALRDESRRQRTYELYSRYYSEAFLEPRRAVRKAIEDAPSAGGLKAASQALSDADCVHFDRYVNFLEEASQQYLAGLLDPDVADEGLAYLAWFHWPQWRDYAHAQRAEQHTMQVCENWEDLYREVAPLYSRPSLEEANRLARSWIAALAARNRALPRRLGRLVSETKRFRIGPSWESMRWTEALKKIRSEQNAFRQSCPAAITLSMGPGEDDYVMCLPTSARDARVGTAVLELRAVRNRSRGRHPSVSYVVSGFAWYESADEALAGIGWPAHNG